MLKVFTRPGAVQLGFLLDHPHRFFMADLITCPAGDDLGLSYEQVRKHVLRVRNVLAELEVPRDLVYGRRQGHSLILRSADLARRKLLRPGIATDWPWRGCLCQKRSLPSADWRERAPSASGYGTAGGVAWA